MSQNQLVNFYETLLESLWVTADDESKLSLNVGNLLEDDDKDVTAIPTRCVQKRLVIPTRSVLKASEWETNMAFHPLSENLLRGESDVLKTLLEIIRFRLGTTLGVLMSTMMEIAVDPDIQAGLTSRQQKYLQKVGKVDAKAAKAINQLLENANLRLISIFIHRGGGANDIKHRRLAQASFPIWDELQGAGSDIQSSNRGKYKDIKCGSAKNKKAIAALFEYLIPEPEDKEAWQVGSDNDVAPYFDALVRLYAQIADHLNSHIHLFRKYIPHAQRLKIDLDWVEELDNLNTLKNKIPPLPGNIGALMKGETEESMNAAATTPARPNFFKQADNIGSGSASNEGDDGTPPWNNNPPANTNTAVETNTSSGSSSSGTSWRDARQRQMNQNNPGTVGFGNVQSFPQNNQPGFMNGGGYNNQQVNYNPNAHASFNPYANVGGNQQQPRFLARDGIQQTAGSNGWNTGGGL